MPECAFHPGVETNVRCAECQRPICPKDMVDTPVGYKCRECARPRSRELAYVKPRQWAIGAGAGLLAAVGGGVLLGWVMGIGMWYVLMLLGFLVGEAVRRGSGGHRTPGIAAVASGCGFAGGLVGGFGPGGAAIIAAAAAVYVLSNRL
ncbi:MAG: hypothetical protein LLG24_00610 [Actinomycetia bacterium]|nr:hypothetical protein [Actinomycetes bacterium]